MEDIERWKAVFAAVVGLLTGLWGWMGWLAVGWIAVMVLDYMTGSAAAAKQGAWSSARAREGIWHKAGMIVVVLVAAGADVLISLLLSHMPAVALPFEYGSLLCPVVLVWYVVSELGSITENAIEMGAPVPSWLTKLLLVSRQAIDRAGEQLLEGEELEGPEQDQTDLEKRAD